MKTKKLLTICCLLAATSTYAQEGTVGIGTIAPKANLDVIGDTIGFRTSNGSWDNLWFQLDGNAVNINASGADNGLNFQVGSNATGTYGDGQVLKTVLTLQPNGNVGVGALPHGSAALEVSSTTKGMLVPRYATGAIANIVTPAKGLLIYDSTAGGFYVYTGTAWIAVSDNMGNHTATQNMRLNGHYLSNNGGNNGVQVDNSGKVTMTSAAIVNGGGQYDFLMKNNGNGDVGFKKGHGALGMTYIIALGGTFPVQGTGPGNYTTEMVGEIRLFGGYYAPQGWALCNGQLLQVSQNSALFAVLGTTYGGNGTTNFGVPDLRGAVPVGAGTATGGYIWVRGEKSD